MDQKIYKFGVFPFGLGLYGTGPTLEEEEESMLIKYASTENIYTSLTTYGDVVLKDTPTISVGDIQISCDGSAFTPIATPTAILSTQVSIQLTPSETNCRQAVVRLQDQTNPPEWNPKIIHIETYGNSNAYVVDNFDNVVSASNIVSIDISSLATSAQAVVINDNILGTSALVAAIPTSASSTDANLVSINGVVLSAATLPLKNIVINNYDGGPAIDVHTVGGEAALLVKSDGGAAAKFHTVSGEASVVVAADGGNALKIATGGGSGVLINSVGGPGINVGTISAPAIYANATGAPTVYMTNPDTACVYMTATNENGQPAISINSSSVGVRIDSIGDGVVVDSDNGFGLTISGLSGVGIVATSGVGMSIDSYGYNVGPAVAIHSDLDEGINVASHKNTVSLVPVMGHGIGIDTTQGPGSGIRIDGLRGFDSENTNESIRLKSSNRVVYIDATDNANGVVIESAGYGVGVYAQNGHGIYAGSVNGAALVLNSENGVGASLNGRGGPGMVINGTSGPGLVIDGVTEGVLITSQTSDGVKINAFDGNAFIMSGAPNMHDIVAREITPTDLSIVTSGIDYIIGEIDNTTYGLSAIKAKTDVLVSEVLGSDIDGMTLEDALTKMLAWAIGKTEYSSDVFTYFKQDNVTQSFALSASDTNRTRL